MRVKGASFEELAAVDLYRHEPEDMERYQKRVGTLRSAMEGMIVNGQA